MLILCHVCSGELSRRANLRDNLEAATKLYCYKDAMSSKAKRKQPSQYYLLCQCTEGTSGDQQNNSVWTLMRFIVTTAVIALPLTKWWSISAHRNLGGLRTKRSTGVDQTLSSPAPKKKERIGSGYARLALGYSSIALALPTWNK